MTDTCCICLQNLFNRDRVTLECGHSLHFSCALRIENRKCPLCRQRYARDVPLSFHQLFSRAVVLMEMDATKTFSPTRKLAIAHELLDTLLTILEVHGNEPSLFERLQTKIPELKREFSIMGYPSSQFESYEERLRRIQVVSR
jgi:Ring finger domain